MFFCRIFDIFKSDLNAANQFKNVTFFGLSKSCTCCKESVSESDDDIGFVVVIIYALFLK